MVQTLPVESKSLLNQCQLPSLVQLGGLQRERQAAEYVNMKRILARTPPGLTIPASSTVAQQGTRENLAFDEWQLRENLGPGARNYFWPPRRPVKWGYFTREIANSPQIWDFCPTPLKQHVPWPPLAAASQWARQRADTRKSGWWAGVTTWDGMPNDKEC